jgi:hypothetical protein
MSFDLLFWRDSEPSTLERVAEIYDKVTDGEVGVVDEGSTIEAFYNDVVEAFPDLAEENMETSPWSSPIYLTSETMIAAMGWSRYKEVSEVLLTLSAKHGLTAFDPQNRVIHRP